VRIVLDTNVLISGVFWRGPPRVLLEACIKNRVTMVCTMEILDEYVRWPVWAGTRYEGP